MKKKLLSLLLTIAMIVTMMPAMTITAFAKEGKISSVDITFDFDAENIDATKTAPENPNYEIVEGSNVYGLKGDDILYAGINDPEGGGSGWFEWADFTLVNYDTVKNNVDYFVWVITLQPKGDYTFDNGSGTFSVKVNGKQLNPMTEDMEGDLGIDQYDCGGNLLLYIKQDVSESIPTWPKLADAMAGDYAYTEETIIKDDAENPLFKVKDTTKGGETTRTIILLSDITAGASDSALEVKAPEYGGKKIVLDLNGHVLDRGLIAADGTGTETNHLGKFIIISSGGNLTLKDSNTEKKAYKFNVLDSGLWKYDGEWKNGDSESDNVKKVVGGIITGGCYDKGGGISVGSENDYAYFTMYGGNIVGNDTTDEGAGGGINLEYCIFTMYGGNIIGNISGCGGGMSIYEDVTCTMYGGNISDNTASGWGGGIDNYGELYLTPATNKEINITGNTASAIGGGGILNFGAGRLHLSGKVIIKDNACLTESGVDNLTTLSKIYIDGSLTDSDINITHVCINDEDEEEEDEEYATLVHDTGILTSGYIAKNKNAKVNDFFHYEGSSQNYMDLSGDGELWIKKVPEGSYRISIPSIPNGKINTDKQIASPGSTVTLTVTPNSGYELSADSIKVTDASGNPVSLNNNQFTMPDKPVTISAIFIEKSGGGGDDPSSSGDKYTATVAGENSLQVEATIKDGKAVVDEISEETLNEVIKSKSGKQTADTIVVDLSQAKQNVTAAELPFATLERIEKILKSNDNKFNSFQVKLSNSSLEVDKTAVIATNDQVRKQAVEFGVVKASENDLNIKQKDAISELDICATYDAYIKSNDHRINDFNGGYIYVTLDLNFDTGKDISKYQAYSVREDGSISAFITEIKEGKLHFKTPRLLDYIVLYDAASQGRNRVFVVSAKNLKDNKVKLNWRAVTGATRYTIYGAKYGHKYKKIKTVKGNRRKFIVKKINGKKLLPHTVYKYRIVARTPKGKQKTKSIYFITGSVKGKYANVNKIKANKKRIVLNVGKKRKVKATYKVFKNKKHLSKVYGKRLRYYSNNPWVARVTKKGKVRAVNPGVAYIFIQDIGGKWCKIKFRVK